MEPVFYQANLKVRADIGKVALMRGPIVYCMEEADNGKNLHLLQVNPKGVVTESEDCKELGTIVRLEAEGSRLLPEAEDSLYHEYSPVKMEQVKLHYIPYYAWCNRGVGEMTVYTNVE